MSTIYHDEKFWLLQDKIPILSCAYDIACGIATHQAVLKGGEAQQIRISTFSLHVAMKITFGRLLRTLLVNDSGNVKDESSRRAWQGERGRASAAAQTQQGDHKGRPYYATNRLAHFVHGGGDPCDRPEEGIA